MSITDVVIYSPRFFVDAKELKQLWNLPILGGYRRILKTGLDENTTTMAVNALLELVDRIGKLPEHLFLYTGHGMFNLSAFLEATGFSEEKIDLLPEPDHYALVALHKAANTKQAAFLLVESLEHEPPSVGGILGSMAIVGYNGSDGGVECNAFRMALGARGQVLRYPGNKFDIRGEPDVLNAIKAAVGRGSVKVIFSNAADLRMLKKAIPNADVETPAHLGYIGSVTPVVSYFKNPEKLNQAILVVADEHQTAILKPSLSGSVNVLETANPRHMLFSQYLAARENPEGNVSIPQGAYISSITYFDQKDARYRLRSVKCLDCQSIQFPPRLRCKRCGGKTEQSAPLPRKASLYSYTKIMKGAAPTEFDIQQMVEGDYCVGIVEFQEGVRVITQNILFRGHIF